MCLHKRAAADAGATPRTDADDPRILDPGVVQLPEADSGPGALPMWCGVSRKPL
ncbi:hypothetical protein [Streptomyces canus]|uniref:hypothetical protein n=1 Tax=Streptomyces canus TaxID=58343 RepID=UPI0033A4EC51